MFFDGEGTPLYIQPPIDSELVFRRWGKIGVGLLYCGLVSVLPQLSIRLRRHPPRHHLLKSRLIHKAGEDVFVLVDALDEDGFEEIDL